MKKIILFIIVALYTSDNLFADYISPHYTTANIEEDGYAKVNVELLYLTSAPKWKASFSKDSIVKLKKFDCSALGRNIVTIYYMNGNKKDSIQSLVDIQANNAYKCPKINRFILSIAGKVETLRGKPVDAEISFWKYSKLHKEINSYLRFDSLEQYFYGLEIKNKDMLGCAIGVSTADIVKIQKHILGMERFTSPYEYLAADVNKDHSISSKDIVEIRKMILGKILQWDFWGTYSEQPWIFIPKDWKFTNNTVPWQSMPPEQYSIGLDHSKEFDFIAIKMGDVNGSANGNFFEDLHSRSSSEELDLEEESKQLDVLIQDNERFQKEVKIYELKFLNGSNINGLKKYYNSK